MVLPGKNIFTLKSHVMEFTVRKEVSKSLPIWAYYKNQQYNTEFKYHERASRKINKSSMYHYVECSFIGFYSL